MSRHTILAEVLPTPVRRHVLATAGRMRHMTLAIHALVKKIIALTGLVRVMDQAEVEVVHVVQGEAGVQGEVGSHKIDITHKCSARSVKWGWKGMMYSIK